MSKSRMFMMVTGLSALLGSTPALAGSISTRQNTDDTSFVRLSVGSPQGILATIRNAMEKFQKPAITPKGALFTYQLPKGQATISLLESVGSSLDLTFLDTKSQAASSTHTFFEAKRPMGRATLQRASAQALYQVLERAGNKPVKEDFGATVTWRIFKASDPLQCRKDVSNDSATYECHLEIALEEEP